MTTKLRQQVQEFNRVFQLRVRSSPGIPADEIIRLHLWMCVEEMLELVEACLDLSGYAGDGFEAAQGCLRSLVERTKVAVDLPSAVDALGDSDYVNESFRDALGVDGEPVADEIHRANLTKLWACTSCRGSGGGLGDTECPVCQGVGLVVKKNDAGKVQKNPTFQPPNIEGELVKQGWRR